MIHKVDHYLSAPMALGIPMVQVTGSSPDAIFATAIDKLGARLAHPEIEPYKSGDVSPDADGQCPGGFWPIPTPVDTYASAQQFCRPIVQLMGPSSNGYDYEAPAGLNHFVWRDAVAHAAASYYMHDHPAGGLVTSDAAQLRPYIDQANAWYQTFKPYSQKSTAQALPWNDVPWGVIGDSAWAWLRTQSASSSSPDGSVKCAPSQYFKAPLGCQGRVDWAAVKTWLASNQLSNPTPNAGAEDTNWMQVVSPWHPGAISNPPTWSDSYWSSRVPWSSPIWDVVPWSQIPWAQIDWSQIITTNDLLGALSKFVATPTTKFVACLGFCDPATQNYVGCVQDCKNSHPGADYSAAPCPNGGLQLSDGSCSYPPCPLGEVRDNVGNCVTQGFGPPPNVILGLHPIITPILQSCPAGQVSVNGSCVTPGLPSLPSPVIATCKTGQVVVNGKCVDAPANPGLSTGTKVVGAFTLAGLLYAGIRLALGKPIIPR